jgi:hypothetical protein
MAAFIGHSQRGNKKGIEGAEEEAKNQKPSGDLFETEWGVRGQTVEGGQVGDLPYKKMAAHRF